MEETAISKKYKAGKGQGEYIDLVNKLGADGGGKVIEQLKVLGDKALEILEDLEQEMGVNVNMAAPDASARTDDKRLDVDISSQPFVSKSQNHSGWSQRI